MVELNLTDSINYWANYPDKTIFRIIKHMEKSESWTFDGQESVEAAFDRLEAAMDQISGIEITDQNEILAIIAYIKTSRYLKILQSMDIVNPGSAAKVIAQAEKEPDISPANKLFLQRNIIFERLRLLTRIFSQTNMDILIKAFEGE